MAIESFCMKLMFNHFEQTDGEWKIIFFITSGIYLFGAIVYWFWAQGEVQPWAIQEIEPEDSRKSRNTQDTGFSNPALDIKE